jgi:DDE superfamily endonuclease
MMRSSDVGSLRCTRPRCTASWTPPTSIRIISGTGGIPASPTLKKKRPPCSGITSGSRGWRKRDELVVCVDEKTQIQALRRPAPDLGMLSGFDRRREWEYQRDGTVNLLVTYTMMTGRLWGRVLLKNDHGHFIDSMNEYLATVPRTIRRIHCILDNGSSHIAKETQAWAVAQAGRVVFHFTPAHASWVNQAELALSAFSRRYLRDRVSASRVELIAHTEQALEEYNRLYAHPFTWSFTRHAMHQWYCQRTSAMVH